MSDSTPTGMKSGTTTGTRAALTTDSPVEPESLMLDVDRIASLDDEETVSYIDSLTVAQTRALLHSITAVRTEHHRRLGNLGSLEAMIRENTRQAADTDADRPTEATPR